jgi:putative transposase
MRYDPEIHHRRSVRLRGWDYARPGSYFITVCVEGKEHRFGEVVEGETIPSAVGKMVDLVWKQVPRRFKGVVLDDHVIMPNHFHAIVRITGTEPHGGADQDTHVGVPLHRIVQWFKTRTTNEYIRGVRESNWVPFRERLWQRNYYEHIIRNARDLGLIRGYVATNPVRWDTDPENPAATSAHREFWT